jgi:hypothetical protein
MPEKTPLRQVPPGEASKGCHSSPGLKAWGFLSMFYKSTSLNFGRTNPEEEGLIQFKNGWGTKENRISYFMYDCGKEAFVTSSDAVYGFHNRIFRMMPMFVLKSVGSSLYKYVG